MLYGSEAQLLDNSEYRVVVKASLESEGCTVQGKVVVISRIGCHTARSHTWTTFVLVHKALSDGD